MSTLLIIFILGLLIFVHELGHFIAARWMGLPVQRFSMGFGPRLCGFQWRGVDVCLSAIPFGGYVMLTCEDDKDYFAIPFRKRVPYLLGGPLANVLLTVVLFSALAAVNGKTGLSDLTYAPLERTVSATGKIVTSLAGAFSNPENLSGVVGIVDQGKKFVGLDLAKALYFGAILSLNLAIFNMLPLPPLDGGRLLVETVQRIIPRFQNAYVPIAITGWVLMIGLMIFATVKDISRVAS